MSETKIDIQLSETEQELLFKNNVKPASGSENPEVITDPNDPNYKAPNLTDEEKLAEKVITAIQTKFPEHTFNDNGDLVNKEGVVVKTAEELDTEFGDPSLYEEKSVVKDLQVKLGIPVLTEEGKPKEYDPNTGYVEYINDVLPEIETRAVEKELSKYPELKDLYSHLKLGGTISDYNRTIDYSKIELNDDLNRNKKIVLASLVESGVSQERAQSLVDASVNKDNHKDQATTALKDLVKLQEQRKLQNEQRLAQLKEKEAEELKQHYSKRFSLIEKESIATSAGSIKIPPTDQQKFKDFISKPIDGNNTTAADIALEKITVEDELLLHYMLFKGFNLKDLVSEAVKTTNRLKIKEMLDKHKDAISKKPSSKEATQEEILKNKS